MRRPLPFLAAAALLAGCATATQPGGPYRVSTDVVAAFARADPAFGVFVVKRDRSIHGNGCSTHVTANRATVVQLWSGEEATFYLPPGDHILGATRDGIALCRSNLSEIKVVSEPGKRQALRTSTDDNGTILIAPTAF